jgi:hypothetical protein
VEAEGNVKATNKEKAAIAQFLRSRSKDPMVRAADDMLEALYALASVSLCFCGEEDAPEQDHRRACRLARRALDKARGRAP